jgi:putative ABC transport system ATP-binding protein
VWLTALSVARRWWQAERRELQFDEGWEMDALDVRALKKTYESNDAEALPVRALRGVDLSMAGGDFVAVMGPSGCGKSTLLNLVAGLDTPSDGEILVAGESLAGKDEDDLARMRRKHIGIVFQFFNLLEGMSVLENVALPAIVAGSTRRQAEGRARDLLDLLGLSDKAGKAPGVLSGGQRQRLAIARALANRPTLLLADEPTGALDSEGGAEIMELFRRLHADGQTILLVTHDDKVAATADRTVHMRDGRIDDGTPRVARETVGVVHDPTFGPLAGAGSEAGA